ncbi:MAG: ABC transporter ATP-binding protein [Balneolales bacterium]|nr:ABC transporter ATP-binding protein [Balneolales bacterium]
MSVIQVSKISKKFGQLVIFQQIDASFHAGIWGIAGPNGSGKSTFMKCVSGLTRPDRGKISWEMNQKKLEKSQLYSYLGFAGPYIRLYDGLTCRENLELILKLTGSKPEEERVAEIMSEVQLPDKMNHYHGKLSSGQQQRVRMAAALIKNPVFLLLDEPGTNLDKAGFTLIQEITERSRKEGRTMLLASNDSRELDLCDHIMDISQFKRKPADS